MSRALLSFNPEAHGSDGDKLLFGVAVPPPARRFVLSPLEELNLASEFLEARPGPGMNALLNYIVHRANTGRAADPRITEHLLPRLILAAAAVRRALQPEAGSADFRHRPEAIFGTELEGLSPEDREFDAAHRFVRFAYEMAREAARAAPGTPPDIVATRAQNVAGHRLAPGLSRAIAPQPADFHSRHRARLDQ